MLDKSFHKQVSLAHQHTGALCMLMTRSGGDSWSRWQLEERTGRSCGTGRSGERGGILDFRADVEVDTEAFIGTGSILCDKAGFVCFLIHAWCMMSATSAPLPPPHT